MADRNSKNKRRSAAAYRDRVRVESRTLRSSDFIQEQPQERTVQRPDRSDPAYANNPYRRKNTASSRRRTTSSRNRQEVPERRNGSPRGTVSSRGTSSSRQGSAYQQTRTSRQASPSRQQRQVQQRAARNSNQRPQGQLKLEKPWRLGGILILFVVLVVVLVSHYVGGSSTEETAVHTYTEDTAASDASEQTEVISGRTTALSNVSSQLSGYLGGLVTAYQDNYAHDPELPEKESVISQDTTTYTRCIVLDAAHGGDDSGYTAGDMVEKDWNLEMVKLIQEKIRSIDSSIEVVLTRDSDEYVELEDRINSAEAVYADLFVSLHCDYDEEDDSIGGFTVQYYMDDEDSERCEYSKTAAEAVEKALQATVDLDDLGTETSIQELLYETSMPAFILQLGHMSNEDDLAVLTDPEAQDKIAEILARILVKTVNDFPERDRSALEESDSEEEDSDDGTADDGTDDDETYDDGTYDDGTYDDGTYDDGTYDDGTYDDGTYDDGTYDDGTYDDGTYYDDGTGE